MQASEAGGSPPERPDPDGGRPHPPVLTRLDDDDPPAGVVAPGRIVTVRYARLDKDVDYVLGADPRGDARAVSARSPVGQALLGRSAGDVVAVELPSGRTEEIHVVGVAPAGDREAA